MRNRETQQVRIHGEECWVSHSFNPTYRSLNQTHPSPPELSDRSHLNNQQKPQMC
ncbi:hypothetical protein [Chamaesiphon sp. VAR_69_metabat_338]|uniref:hypothetical protein n=1 Tax=Chamaesiphon sp. VAR_69_metabat_338 TaxID=2964704 RepID=UPI00286DFB28|nr:hypothetical protein [Chamaesiphon sp. VAR_69_metabat_338]